MLNSVKNKILFPVVAILLVLVVTIVVLVLVQVSSLTDSLTDERMEGMALAAASKLSDFEEKTRLIARAVAANYYVTEHIINWNESIVATGPSREEVQSYSAQSRDSIIATLSTYADELGVDSFVVRDADGRIIVRLHAIDQYNDIDGSAAAVAAFEGRTTTSYSSSATMPMGLNTTVPIRHGGQIIGTMTPLFFLHTNEFVDYFAAAFNAQVTIFGGPDANTRVATTLMDGGQRITGTDLDNEEILNTVITNRQTFIGDAYILETPYSVAYYPLIGAGGNTVGMLFVGFSNEKIVTASNTLLITMVIVGAVGLALAVAVVFIIVGKTTKPLAPLTGFMQRAATTGDLVFNQTETTLLGKYAQNKDEIGRCIAATSEFVNEINHEMDVLAEIAEGNLDLTPNVLSEKDKVGISLTKVVDSLNTMFGEIQSSTAQVSTGSKQIADGAQALAQGSTEQAASVQQLSSSIAEIAQKTKGNAEMAKKAATLANDIKGSAEKGSRQMDEMMIAVKDISESGQNISKVIKSIDDIAFQTNILALNAAVEAARAGQHGKGFAVVAEEVRNLASKSAEAAKDTESLIADSISKAELGSRIADETAASLVEIVKGIGESSQLVGDIALSSEEQSEGITQINTGIDQVAQVIQQNSATAEESAAASEEMSGQSDMLENLITQFKLKDSGSGTGRISSAKPAESLPAPAKAESDGSFGKY